MSSNIAIRVENLGKRYHIYDKPQDRLKQSLWRGRKQFYGEFWALKDASFEVQRGEAVGIIGRNGSGKSTLLQMIAGTLTPTAGQITVNGRVAALLELGSGFNLDFTGRENIYMNGTILGLTRAEIDQRFDQIVAFADIGDFIEQPVKTYSSGMMIRLAFSVSVNIEPEILIVDEALAVGDMAFQMKCMQRLEALTKSGTTLLFVSHDIGAIKAFCQKVVYLKQGVVKKVGQASDMIELYLLDLRDEQKQALADNARMQLKPALGKDKSIAFGTNQGRVVSAIFEDTGASQGAYLTGDTITIKTAVEFDHTLKNPAISLIIHDNKMIDIAGRSFPIKNPIQTNEIRHANLSFTFEAPFNAGPYFITLRLEERVSANDFFPIDKQVGALSMQIMKPPSKNFIGMVELKIDCAEL